jgi:membrane protein implicated in regulation of membrane protease activity
VFNLEASTIWWILTGVLVAAELFTGTFYLLLLALAAGFGGLSVHAGFGTVTQISVAAVTGVFSLLVWRTLKLRRLNQNGLETTTDSFDIGQTVFVSEWNANGPTRIHYRGTDWSCALTADASPIAGPYRIAQILNNQLILEPIPNASPITLKG